MRRLISVRGLESVLLNHFVGFDMRRLISVRGLESVLLTFVKGSQKETRKSWILYRPPECIGYAELEQAWKQVRN